MKRYLVTAGIEVVNDPEIHKRLIAGEDLWNREDIKIDVTRYEVGEVVAESDIPAESLGWLVEQGILVPSKSPRKGRDDAEASEPEGNPEPAEEG